MRVTKSLLMVGLASALLACGGGGGGGGSPAPATNYAVGGTISGLITGETVVLQDNGANATTFGTNGSQTYYGAIPTGTAYAITVQTQPLGETCTVSNGTGTVNGASVTNVAVSCVPNKYTIGGNVSGLANSDNLVLQDNGGDNTPVVANGGFTFAMPVASGTTYNVTVSTPPVGKSCAVANGTGKVGGANISNVSITCSANLYSIGVTVSGLPYGASLVLQNEGGDNLTVQANGTASFHTTLTTGSPYAVTVFTQPTGNNCTVSNGSGTVAMSNISNVVVDCPHFAYVNNNLSNDISIYKIDNASGVLTPTSQSPLATTATNPYGMAISPNLKFLYLPSSGTTGILGFSSDPATGVLAPINGGTAYAAGPQPWCMTFNPTGSLAFVTDYANSTLATFTANPTTGDLVASGNGPYASGNAPFGVVVAPNANFVYVANDNQDTVTHLYSVSAFQFDTAGALTSVAGSPFTVPDLDPVMAIDPTGHFAYVPGNTNGNVYGFTIDASGALTPFPSGPVAAGSPNPSGITIHPNGKFVYVANYNTQGTISVYTITPTTGVLTPVGSPVAAGNGTESVTIDPTGRFAYAMNQVSNDVYAYSIDLTTGALTPLATGSPVAAGNKPEGMVVR